MSDLKLYTTVIPVGKGNTVWLEWIVISMDNVGYYTIEKSVDGKKFKHIDKIKKTGQPGQETFYLFIDDDPGEIVYYKLKDSDSMSSSCVEKVITSGKRKNPEDLSTPNGQKEKEGMGPAVFTN